MPFEDLLFFINDCKKYTILAKTHAGHGFSFIYKNNLYSPTSPHHARNIIINTGLGDAEKMIDNLDFIRNFNKKVFDLRSEKLFREAEEDFYYNIKPQDAIKKLNEAIKYSPCFVKALLFLGNINLLEGNLAEALVAYKKAEKHDRTNTKTYAALANLYYLLERYDTALNYVNLAFKCEKAPFGALYKTLFELQSSILIKQRKYKEAERIIEDARYKLVFSELQELKTEKMRLIKQKTALLQKIEKSKLKVVK